MKGSGNHRAWRHNRTGTLPATWLLPFWCSVNTALLKIRTLRMGPGTPSLPFGPGLLWVAALSLSLSMWLSLSFETSSFLTIVNFLCWKFLLFQRRSEGIQAYTVNTFLETCTLHGDMSKAQGSAAVPCQWVWSLHPSPDCAPASKHLQPKPYVTFLCEKGYNWTLDFKTSPPTVLPISGIALPPPRCWS